MNSIKYVLPIIIGVLMFSCSRPPISRPSKITIEAKNGEGEVKDVNFQVSLKLYDSLGMTREEVETIANLAVIYADWNVENKLTYEFDDGGYSNWILPFDTTIMVSVKGQAKNSFGVPMSITSNIHFDKNGVLIFKDVGRPYIN